MVVTSLRLLINSFCIKTNFEQSKYMIVINIRQLITDYKYFQYFNKFNF